MSERDLPSLSLRARALIAEERSRAAEDEALKLRVLERAREAVSPDRLSGVALRSAQRVRAPLLGRRWSRSALLVAASLGLGGLAAAGLLAGTLTGEPVATSPATRVPVPRASEPLVPSLQRQARVEESAPETRPPTPLVTSARPAAPLEASQAAIGRQYAVELGLLEPARKSIASGDFNAALGAIGRHQREYPAGQLAQEREALRVRAVWGLGQKAEAERLASAFRKRYPRSALLSWMKEPPKARP